jgi:predicted nucleic acid-binding Zn ribbon protein
LPTFEYCCNACEIVFEETFIDPDEAKQYQHAHPCCKCDAIARRIASTTNFQFKGTPGQSGAHDLDYPTLDKAVGRSSNQKWQEFNEEKEKRDKVRQESGQHAITQVGDQISPTPADKLKVREHAIRAFNEAKSKDT